MQAFFAKMKDGLLKSQVWKSMFRHGYEASQRSDHYHVGAIPAALLAILVELIFEGVERWLISEAFATEAGELVACKNGLGKIAA